MKAFLKSCTAIALACSFSGQAVAQVKEIGAGEGQVNIIAWPGYIERGETDKNYDWGDGFRKGVGLQGQRQDGCHLRRNGGADERGRLRPRHRFGDASLRLVAGKRVQPINTDLVKSWSTVDERLKDAPWFTVDGQHYGVPISGARTC